MQIDISYLSYAFAVGMYAFFNPCGFSMLPAYVAHYLATENVNSKTLLFSILKAVKLSFLVSAGFLTVFALVAALFSLIRGVLTQYVFLIGAGMGFLLVLLGIAMLAGQNPLMIPALERLAGQVGQLQGNSERKSGWFYYLYGVSYAIASLGCASPIFLIVIGSAFSSGWLNGVAQFGAYSAGMATMMLGVSLVTAISKDLIKRVLPQILIGFRWIGGLVVLAAGIYLIWYNLFYSGLIEI